MSDEKKHPIQVVARRTGLSPEVLRVWEKRYGIVAPARTPTGRRLYSDADIESLRLVRKATLAGRRVGEVSRLSIDALKALVRGDEQAALTALPSAGRSVRPGRAAAFVAAATASTAATTAQARSMAGASEAAVLLAEESMDAVRELDGPRLEGILTRALMTLGATAFLDDLAAPLLRSVGEQWEQGRLDPYQEHLATATIRRTVARLFVWHSTDASGPAAVVATPAGQRHEIGAILAACAVMAEGWRLVYLGADLPARDIARAVEQARARVVALSIVYPQDDPNLIAELSELSHRLPRGVQLIVGGGAASSYVRTLRKIRAEILPDIKDFRSLLSKIGSAGAARG